MCPTCILHVPYMYPTCILHVFFLHVSYMYITDTPHVPVVRECSPVPLTRRLAPRHRSHAQPVPQSAYVRRAPLLSLPTPALTPHPVVWSVSFHRGNDSSKSAIYCLLWGLIMLPLQHGSTVAEFPSTGADKGAQCPKSPLYTD